STRSGAGDFPPALPAPVLYSTSREFLTVDGKQFTQYNFDVMNKSEYPPDFFAASPDLPPCGSNTKASRTWVDFYEQTGKRIWGFCALSAPSDLGKIYYRLPSDVIPPSYVYIELTDHKTNTKYKSNLAETSE